MAGLLSVIIPSRGESFLTQTVNDVLSKASGDIEIIVALDGAPPVTPLPADKRLTVLHWDRSRGMRYSINTAIAASHGDYLLKCDAHVMFAPGFDEILIPDCYDNTILVPRRQRLDADNWCLQVTHKPPVDYHYLSCPITNRDGYSMHGSIWAERHRERGHLDLDETMSWQGSCHMMRRTHWDRIGPMSDVGYGGFSQEPTEIGLKTQLGGGQILVSKKTWFAHLHKGKLHGRGYFISRDEVVRGHEYGARFWINNQWPDRIHDIDWLIDRFSPVPTWPADWQLRRNESTRDPVTV